MADLVDNEEDFDIFIDKIKNEYKDGWTEENWESEMEKHPFFMTKAPDENEVNQSAAIEALRQIKWEEDENETPLSRALKYKEEGNLMFKNKVYPKAISSYTQGLKVLGNDLADHEIKEMISTLHSNRAAAHFHIKNYRSALNDCIFAYKMNRHNIKAVLKAAECCFELKLFNDSIKWSEIALIVDADNLKAKDIRIKCVTAQKTHDKEERKKKQVERAQTQKQQAILSLIKANKLHLEENDEKFLELLNESSPLLKTLSLVLDETNDPNQLPTAHLSWPVVFMYPEYGQTDFIEAFDEFSRFEDHLSAVFSETPGWDKEKKYNPKSVEIYYEDLKRMRLVKVKKSKNLLETMKEDGFIIQMGTPKFLLMVKNSDFEKIYLQRFNELNS